MRVTVNFQKRNGEYGSFYVPNANERNLNQYFKDSGLSMVHTIFVEHTTFMDNNTEIIRSQRGLMEFYKKYEIDYMI